MNQVKEIACSEFVIVNHSNIEQIFNENLLNIIKKNVTKNSNYIDSEEKEEITQRVLIRLYKSLKSKLRRYNEAGEPKVIMESKKFYSFIKRFCINEIIQWWRKNKKENNKRVIFHEELDYSKPIVEIIESLKYKNPNDINSLESYFCNKCNTRMEGNICPKCGHNIVPYILNIGNLRKDLECNQENEDDCLNLYIMSEQLKEYFSHYEVKIIIMLAQNMTQKDIYEEIFKNKYKNPSIVHKKIKKIKKKIQNSKEIKEYIKRNLYYDF